MIAQHVYLVTLDQTNDVLLTFVSTGAARFTNGVSHSDVSTKSKRETNEKKNRGTVVAVSYKLGTPLQECPEWLVATAKDLLPQPERLAFTPPARGEGMYTIFSSLFNSSVSNFTHQRTLNRSTRAESTFYFSPRFCVFLPSSLIVSCLILLLFSLTYAPLS